MSTNCDQASPTCSSRAIRKQWFARAASGVALCIFAPAFLSAQASSSAAKCPPQARIDSVKDTYGGTVVADPYRWLEDQQSSETRMWIEAEQKCTDAALSSVADRAFLSSRLGELLYTDSYEAPTERGGRYFFRKRPAGGDLSLLYIRRGQNAPEEILIDPLPWSADHSASVSLEV